MVESSGRRSVVSALVGGCHYAAVYDPDDRVLAVRRLCLLGEWKVWPWSAVAALKSEMMAGGADVITVGPSSWKPSRGM
jgi:hypothetical protein